MLSLATRAQWTTLLDAVTLRAPDDRTAIIYMETDCAPVVVTRHMFAEAANASAARLAALGVQSGDLLVLAYTQNLDSVFAFWGALRLGAIPSMFPTLTDKLDPDVYMHSMAELARLSGVAAVLTTDEFAPALRPRLPCPVFSTSDLRGSTSAVYPVGRPVDPPAGAIAYLQHSSGTTGLQKGVALSHTAVLNQIAAYSDAIALAADDVIVSWLPLYHDMGLIAGFLLPLVQGVPLVLMSPFDWVQHPAMLLRAIHEYRGTLCWLPNFAYNHCARRIRQRDSDGLSLASMRLFVNCSEPVRHDSQQLFLERFTANGLRPEMLGASYAMAENTFAVTQTPPGRVPILDAIDGLELEQFRYAKPASTADPAAQMRVSCGPPIPRTEVRVLDQAGRPLPERRVGQLAVRSDCLLSGYYRRPDLQPFTPDGWYLTGDMGYIAGGEVYVVGRSRDLIINAGKNIYPADIEAMVNEVPGVKVGRAVAFGVADAREGTELLAVVAEVDTADASERSAIARAIRGEVARRAGVTVSYVHLVGPKWLLKTSSGKLARGANREKWLRERDPTALR